MSHLTPTSLYWKEINVICSIIEMLYYLLPYFKVIIISIKVGLKFHFVPTFKIDTLVTFVLWHCHMPTVIDIRLCNVILLKVNWLNREQKGGWSVDVKYGEGQHSYLPIFIWSVTSIAILAQINRYLFPYSPLTSKLFFYLLKISIRSL
jgi:hypothetical protein